MNLLGLIIFVVGLIGLGAAFIGFTADMQALPVAFRGVPAWGIIAAVGGVLFFFTRRARD